MYTNKVIEVFNAGLLNLDERERGITLRAYLAEKLQCDPMRITKKYTGAACLGKRVYHFDYQQADHLEAEKLRRELLTLENSFKTKLEQLNKKKSNEPAGLDESYRISTPGIDALLQRTKSLPSNPNKGISNNEAPNIPAFHGYPSHIFTPPTGYIPPHVFSVHQALFGSIPFVESVSHSDSGVATSMEENGGSKKVPQAHQPIIPQFFRGPNGELYMPSSYGPGYPPYFVAMPPPFVALNEEGNSRLGSFPISYPSLPAGFPLGHNLTPSWKDIHAAAHLNSVLPAVGMSLPSHVPIVTPTIPVVDITELEPKIKRPRRSSNNLKVLEAHRAEADLSAVGITSSEDELLNNKIKLSEVDQNEAASSLLGFINHVKRNSSQEDLAEFYEGIHQKTASGTTLKSPNSELLDLSLSKAGSFGVDLHGLDKAPN